jgi:DNA primase
VDVGAAPVIPFRSIATDAAAFVPVLVPRWLPDARDVGDKLLARCPFHAEKSPSFYVYKSDGHYHCYGCGAHSDMIALLAHLRGIDMKEAARELARSIGHEWGRE